MFIQDVQQDPQLRPRVRQVNNNLAARNAAGIAGCVADIGAALCWQLASGGKAALTHATASTTEKGPAMTTTKIPT